MSQYNNRRSTNRGNNIIYSSPAERDARARERYDDRRARSRFAEWEEQSEYMERVERARRINGRSRPAADYADNYDGERRERSAPPQEQQQSRFEPLFDTPAQTGRSVRQNVCAEAFDNTSEKSEAETKREENIKKARMLMLCMTGALILIANLILLVYMPSWRGDGRGEYAVSTVLDQLDAEQVTYIIKGYADKRLDSVRCSIPSVDGQLKLSDFDFEYVGSIEGTDGFFIEQDAQAGVSVTYEYVVYNGIRFNKTTLRSALNDAAGEDCVDMVEPRCEFDYDNSTMTVYAGSDGWGIGTEDFLLQLTTAMAAAPEQNDIAVNCAVGEVKAPQLDAERLYAQAHSTAKDAWQEQKPNGDVIYYPEIIGVDFDKDAAAQILAQGGTQWIVPIKVTMPAIDLKELKKYTFPDLLGSYYTYYDSGNRGRTNNLSLAAQKINGLVLEPGETFSFNDTVGQRTAANGFAKATVYAGEGTAEGYGGGICQTSSTLYYTCILANLEITERRNHMYTVGYMTSAVNRYKVYGNDATINWGSADLKVTNNKEYPIRLDIWADSGILYCNIYGTADGYTADFEYRNINTKDYNIKYLPADGTEDQSGHTGRTVEVYRVIYYNGEQVDRVFEHKDTYIPMTQIYYTNTLPDGFEYGKEYPQDYVPEQNTTDTTTTTTQSSADTTTTTAPAANNDQ